MKTLHAVLFAALALLAPTAAAVAAEDVVIVYDASGSMWRQIDGVSKLEIAREVMVDLVRTWSADTNLGLVAYGHRSEGDCGDIETLIAPGPLDRASFIDTVNAIRPKGKTPISAAVQHAADLLSYRDNPATVVLISDGLETCKADPCALAEQLARQGVKFTTHVVGFDLDDEDNAQLACIADNTGGVFLPAQNAAELKDALAHVQSVMDLQPMTLAPEPEPEPEIAEFDTEITAPSEVTTGSSFAVSWSSSVHPDDMVTIVPAGADEGSYGTYERVRDNSQARLVAPADPGLYEVRYILNQGRRTLASAVVEVVEAEVSISAPEQVTTGASFAVSWSAAVHPNDMVTIVPAGADEGNYGTYERVRDNSQGKLVAPAEPGLYELRYILNEGRRTLASIMVEVVEAELGISGPIMVRAGTPVRVSWSSSVHPNDMVTIVPADAEAGSYGQYVRVHDTLRADLKAPGETGLYEVRYILNEGRRTLASYALEVVDADAALDGGASLTVPAQAAAGSSITVSWSGGADSADQRIALARADQADFSWISAHKVGTATTLELPLPAEAGRYEVRYLDVSGRVVLGRAIVEVQ
ncbi:MAG: VWA domain-containing protein [Devosia sp.]|nr:VWA domain-containing protein [Devosia sp.]